MQGEGWRRSLLVFLLAASLADVSGDLSDDGASKSGYLSDDEDSNESRTDDGEAEVFAENLLINSMPGYSGNDEGHRTSQGVLDLKNTNNHIYIKGNQDQVPGSSVYNLGHKAHDTQIDLYDDQEAQDQSNGDQQAGQIWINHKDPFFTPKISVKGSWIPKPPEHSSDYQVPVSQIDINDDGQTHTHSDGTQHAGQVWLPQLDNDATKNTANQNWIKELPHDPDYIKQSQNPWLETSEYKQTQTHSDGTQHKGQTWADEWKQDPIYISDNSEKGQWNPQSSVYQIDLNEYTQTQDYWDGPQQSDQIKTSPLRKMGISRPYWPQEQSVYPSKIPIHQKVKGGQIYDPSEDPQYIKQRWTSGVTIDPLFSKHPKRPIYTRPAIYPSKHKGPVHQVNVNKGGPNHNQYDVKQQTHQDWKGGLKINPLHSLGDTYMISKPSVYPSKNPGHQTQDHKGQQTQLDSDEWSEEDDQNSQQQNIGPVDSEEQISQVEQTAEDLQQQHQNEHPYNKGDRYKWFSKLIPKSKHVNPETIPGAGMKIRCLKEGDIHKLWRPDFQCLVCVCLAARRRLSPVCVSCDTCLTPGPPPGPTEPPAPPTPPPPTPPPPTPPPPPVYVSCHPLPVNVPFPSPIDPCKICVCTETLTKRGKKDVKIHCKHNPQCVLPTTPKPEKTTPIPVPVCDKLPANVPFPHPGDFCKICQCIESGTKNGQIEKKIMCYPNPECQPTTTQAPEPDITDLPPIQICDRYAQNVLFPHPLDRCQVCKCTTVPSKFLPHNKKITCYVKHDCTTTPEPWTTTTPVPQTPPPQPENVRCAPLPVGLPFKNPINPCQTCTCTETADIFGQINVEIKCQDNLQCVINDDITTLPPDTSTGIPLPACKHFPEDVLFPHPTDECQVCKCHSNQNNGQEQQIEDIKGGQEQQIKKIKGHPNSQQHIHCYTKPECLPTPPPPTTPEPKELCEQYPLDTYFPEPSDPCKVCKCHVDQTKTKIKGHVKPTLSCFIRPECAPTTEPPLRTDNATCDPLPTEKPFQHPLHPCQICICTEHRNPYGDTEVLIECQESPQCVIPPDFTTISPEIMNQTNVPACKNFPEGVYFPHPEDRCKSCKCDVVRRGPHTQPEEVMSCVVKPECLPPPPSTTARPNTEPSDICASYPINTPFDDPYDECQTCVCKQIGSAGIKDKGQHTLFPPKYRKQCYIKPECSQQTTASPDFDVCKGYPINTPFDDPQDQCQTCVCKQIGSAGIKDKGQHTLFPPKYRKQCYVKPECSQQSSESPEFDVCKGYPINTPFNDPQDQCQTCVCKQIGNAGIKEIKGQQDKQFPFKYQIQCYIKPECSQQSTETPDIDVCEGYSINTPFDDPNDQCRTCVCTQISSAGIKDQQNFVYPPKYQIQCQIKPECLQTTTESHENTHVCEGYPINTPFDDPNDQCRTCVCTQTKAKWQHPLFPPIYQIECQFKPECSQQSTESPEIDVCKGYPINTPFDDPQDQCQTCVCKQIGNAGIKEIKGQQDAQFPFKYQIQCYIKPECLQQSTETPDIDVCGGHPINTPFDDPNDQCRTCVCTQSGSAGIKGEQNFVFPPQYRIQCFIKPECSRKTTEHPDNDICKIYPRNTPFDDPNDQCRTCTCTYKQLGSGHPGTKIISLFPPQLQILCQIKPECLPTPPTTTVESVTEDTHRPTDVCGRYPINTPFDHPDDKCRTCTCLFESSSAPTKGPQGFLPPPQLQIHCHRKLECTSGEISEPVSCKPLPSGVPFQSPLNPCQVCTCTETVDEFGESDVLFKCRTNPECVIPQDVTTVPPDSHTSPVPLPACAQFPSNVEFPHPSEACLLCKCTVKTTPWGQQQQLISCFANPNCGIATTTTPAPWTPAPGPLPGPAPHESCSPYIPNQPFQHPWDECQVCICKEAISRKRITIEVNCYTKPSCCYELPIEIPDTQEGQQQLIDENQQIDMNPGWAQSWVPQKQIGSTGGNLIGPTGGNVIYRPGGNLVRPTGDNLFTQDKTQTKGQNHGGGDYDILYSDEIGGHEPTKIGYRGTTGGNVIGSSQGWPSNTIRPTGGNAIRPTGDNVIGPTGGNVIGLAGGSVGGYTGSSLSGYAGGLIGPHKGTFYQTPGIFINGKDIYGHNYRINHGNLNLPLKSAQPVSWRQTYLSKPQEILQVKGGKGTYSEYGHYGQSGHAGIYTLPQPQQQHYSTRMRTKSGRPSDSDTEDYEERN